MPRTQIAVPVSLAALGPELGTAMQPAECGYGATESPAPPACCPPAVPPGLCREARLGPSSLGEGEGGAWPPTRMVGMGAAVGGGVVESSPAGSETESLINISDVRWSSELLLNSKHLEKGFAVQHLSVPILFPPL